MASLFVRKESRVAGMELRGIRWKHPCPSRRESQGFAHRRVIAPSIEPQFILDSHNAYAAFGGKGTTAIVARTLRSQALLMTTETSVRRYHRHCGHDGAIFRSGL